LKYLILFYTKFTFYQVWDYDSKNCVQTLEGHKNNVTSICAHPEIPIIITTSEDSTVKIWDAITFRYFIFSLPIQSFFVFIFFSSHFFKTFSTNYCRLQNTLNFDLERVWCIGYKKGSSE
jgi:coatomer subunit beta'